MIRIAAALVAGLVAGFFAARALPGEESRSVAPPAPAAAPAATCLATLRPADVAALKAELLGALAAAPRAAPEVAEAPAPPAPPSDAEVAAAVEAGALLDGAIAAGAWTDADVTRLRALLPALSPEERASATSAVVRAINDQRLVLATRTPL